MYIFFEFSHKTTQKIWQSALIFVRTVALQTVPPLEAYLFSIVPQPPSVTICFIPELLGQFMQLTQNPFGDTQPLVYATEKKLTSSHFVVTRSHSASYFLCVSFPQFSSSGLAPMGFDIVYKLSDRRQQTQSLWKLKFWHTRVILRPWVSQNTLLCLSLTMTA